MAQGLNQQSVAPTKRRCYSYTTPNNEGPQHEHRTPETHRRSAGRRAVTAVIHPVAKIITTPAGVVMIATHGPELLKPGTYLLYSADDVQRLVARINELESKRAR